MNAQAENTTALQTRQPLNIDMSHGVGIANYDEAMQMAALVHHSGLAPKSLDTVQKVAVGMLMAVEVGLPIITGLQNIAVINGKAGVWGDAVLSLVRNSGQMEPGYPKEREEGTPFTDGWTFYCTVKRRGSHEVTGSFSWAEAKKAGFDNPQLRNGGKDVYSPWTRFPRRMMQWKARQWVYRDEFGDVLRGMRMAEELHDVVDLEPSETGGYAMPGASDVQQPHCGDDLAEKPTFDDQIPEDVGREKLLEYARICAEHFGQDLEEFKRQIVASNQIEDFLSAFRGWEQKNPTQPMDKGENSQQGGEELSGTPEKDLDPWDEFRNEFINLRQAGFSTWIFKNKARMADAPEEIQQEAQAKWEKLYPDNQWPLNSNPEESPKTDETETHPPHGGDGEIPPAWDMPKICEPFIEKLGNGVAFGIMNTDNPAQIPQEDRISVIEALRKAAENVQ
ncbi:conserved domain protein [delta proteobacterium NaphS2]|nr:conserved domain protein [delta proteobacterium NaphS2]